MTDFQRLRNERQKAAAGITIGRSQPGGLTPGLGSEQLPLSSPRAGVRTHSEPATLTPPHVSGAAGNTERAVSAKPITNMNSSGDSVSPVTPSQSSHWVPDPNSPHRHFAGQGAFPTAGHNNISPFIMRRALYHKDSSLTPILSGSSDSFSDTPAQGAYQDVFGNSDPMSDAGPMHRPQELLEAASQAEPQAETQAAFPDCSPQSETIVPLPAIRARMPEYGRQLHDTPLRRVITKGGQMIGSYISLARQTRAGASPPSPIQHSHFDIDIGGHRPPPFPVDKGAPWDQEQETEEEPLAPIKEWYGPRNPNNRFFLLPPHLRQKNANGPVFESRVDAQPLRRQPPRVATTQSQSPHPLPSGDVFKEAVKPILDESDCSEEADAFVPPEGPNAGDDDGMGDSDPSSPEQTKARRKAKGKATQRNVSAGPSESTGGRPTILATQEIEHVGHRIQSDMVALSEKLGLTYDTVMRKAGLSQQSV